MQYYVDSLSYRRYARDTEKSKIIEFKFGWIEPVK